MPKRILVPVDFSPTSIRAFQYALELASRTGGAVTLYHIFEPAEAGLVEHETTRRAYNEQLQSDLLKELNRVAEKYRPSFPKVSVSTVIGRTPLIDNILGFAEHHYIDLIVMGTQGASGLKRTLLGTVASKVLEESSLPVLLIPESYEWKLPHKLVLATDYHPADKIALPLLLNLAKAWGATVTVVRLVSGYATPEDLQVEEKRFEEYRSVLQREAQQKAQEEGPMQKSAGQDDSQSLSGSQTETVETSLEFKLIKTPSVTETLERLDEEIPYDLLTMVKRKKNFFQRIFLQSFTRNMAYLTRLPFLSVPTEE